MITQITVTFARTRNGDPLMVIEDCPGPGVELLPARARALARALMAAADDCEAAMREEHARRQQHTYTLGAEGHPSR